MRHSTSVPTDHIRTSYLTSDVSAGRIRVLDAAQEEFFVQGIRYGFERTFPRSGADVLWDNGPTDPGEGLDEFERAKLFIKTVFRSHNISAEDQLALLWDDASDPSFQMSGTVLLDRLEDILRPPNLYVVPMDVSWCICHTHWGELGFGYSPCSLQHKAEVVSGQEGCERLRTCRGGAV
jgi:hypothetical protein